MSSSSTYAYLYRWTQLSTGKWYVGSRTARNSHPNDGYICSSKIVKPMILENRDDWHREILCVGEPAYIRKLECDYLQAIDAKSDELSYNQHNNNGHPSTAGRSHSPETKAKMREHHRLHPRRGWKHTEEWKRKHSERNKGRTHTPETRARQAASAKGRRAARWQVTDPQGNTFVITNMPDFCAEKFEYPNSALKYIRCVRVYKDYHFVKL